MSFLGNVVNLGNYNPGQPISSSFFLSAFGSTKVNEKSSMMVSAYYRGVIYLSTQVAKLPITLRDINNRKIESEIAQRALRLLMKRPNEEMTAFTFWCFIIQSAVNSGNGYAEIVRNRKGQISQLYPIKSDHVQPFRDTKGTYGIKNRLLYRILKGHPDGSGRDIILLPKDILHIKNFHTADGIEGLSTIEYASNELGIAIGANKFSNGLYANGGIPSGIISTKGAFDTATLTRLEKQWNERFGDRKVGGTAILEEGATYSPMTLNPEMLQFLETKKLTVPQLARFLGVPPTKMYATEAAKYSNIEQENIGVAVDTIDPWLKNIQDEIDFKFFDSRLGVNTVFDISALFRADSKGRADYYKGLFGLGALNSNEIREKEGEAPHKDGNRYYIASNNFTPMDRIDEALDDQKSKKDNKKDVSEDDTDKELKVAALKYLSKNK